MSLAKATRRQVHERRVDLCVEPNKLERRRQEFTAPPPAKRGYKRLFAEHVMPAHLGADFDFLEADHAT